MAAKSCDDPMDLGPFLQNYVMKNPFSESSLLVTKSSATTSSSSSEASSARHSRKETKEDYAGHAKSSRRPRTVAEMLQKARQVSDGDSVPRHRTKRVAMHDSLAARPTRPREDGGRLSGAVIVKDAGKVAKRSFTMYANPQEMMDKYGNSTNADRSQIESW